MEINCSDNKKSIKLYVKYKSILFDLVQGSIHI